MRPSGCDAVGITHAAAHGARGAGAHATGTLQTPPRAAAAAAAAAARNALCTARATSVAAQSLALAACNDVQHGTLTEIRVDNRNTTDTLVEACTACNSRDVTHTTRDALAHTATRQGKAPVRPQHSHACGYLSLRPGRPRDALPRPLWRLQWAATDTSLGGRRRSDRGRSEAAIERSRAPHAPHAARLLAAARP